jgi:hypothetical protein
MARVIRSVNNMTQQVQQSKSKQSQQCRWCTEVAIESHFTPGCLYRAASELLPQDVYGVRNLLVPNRTVQDIGKYPLLCQPCDNLFSKAEGKFCEHIYKPLLNGMKQFDYGDWLIRFAVSLAWKRTAVWLEQVNEHAESAILVAEAKRAVIVWANFLQGKTEDPGHYEHHLFFTRFLAASDISEFAQLLFKTTFDTTPVTFDEKVLFVSTIFPGCMMVSSIVPSMWQYSTGTRIMPSGKLQDDQTISSNFLKVCAQSYETDAAEAVRLIKPYQRQKMATETSRRRIQ